MKPYKSTYWKNKKGEIIETGFQNGIIAKILSDPDPWYIDNVMKPKQEKVEEREKEYEKKIKIQEKLIEMAEKELEKEKK